MPRQICRENYTTPAGQARSWSQYNNEQECTANDGKERDEGGGEMRDVCVCERDMRDRLETRDIRDIEREDQNLSSLYHYRSLVH